LGTVRLDYIIPHLRTPLTTVHFPSISWLLIEYGYLGTALFAYLLWLIYRRGHVLRHSPDRELRIFGRALEGMTFVYVVLQLYAPAWQSDTMNFIYWPLVGLFVYDGEEARQKQALQRACAR
jgi:hypothetical protein